MVKEQVTLRLDGSDEHRGHVMARALVEKLDLFLQTYGRFERAYIGKKTRQTDFEVVSLSHNSPAEIGLNPVPRVINYTPEPAILWTFKQWEQIARGETPDPLIDDDLIGDVIALCERENKAEFSRFTVSYGRETIAFDEIAQANAARLRALRKAEERALPWMKGMSAGTLTGELRSVLDTHNERQIVVCPPVGPAIVRCVFSESLREAVRENLFKFVRVHGLLHYGDLSPFPTLIELDRIEPLDETGHRHMLEGRGLFRDSVYSDQQTSDLW